MTHLASELTTLPSDKPQPNFQCIIRGQPWTVDQLDQVQYHRHLHNLHSWKTSNIALTDLTHADIDLLSKETARQESLKIRQSHSSNEWTQLMREELKAAETFWRNQEKSKTEISEVDIDLKGLTAADLHVVMAFDQLDKTYLFLNPDHYFAKPVAQALHQMEIFGMFGAPVELHTYSGDDLEVPGAVRALDYPHLVKGGTKFVNGDDARIYAYHQFRDTQDGLQMKLSCIFPGGTPKEIVQGHEIHMAIEVLEALRRANPEQL